jgi:hypothetical protein
MIINNKLNWSLINEALANSPDISVDWFVNKTIELEDKFTIISLLLDYIQDINSQSYFDRVYDGFRFEIYKELLVLGAYMGFLVPVEFCTPENYCELEKNGLGDIKNYLLDHSDYNVFNKLIDKYVNIDNLIYLSEINKMLEKTLTQITDNEAFEEATQFITENQETLDRIEKIIEFNNNNISVEVQK